MFKDTDEALARLAEELLRAEDETEAEEVCEEEEYEEDYDEDFDEDYEEDYDEDQEEDEVPPEYIYDDTRAARGPAVYQNYSNDYGRNLRNYASGYRAYNADDCDEDLDTFSDEVYEEPPERSNTGLIVTACVLSAILAAVVLLVVLKFRGVL